MEIEGEVVNQTFFITIISGAKIKNNLNVLGIFFIISLLQKIVLTHFPLIVKF